VRRLKATIEDKHNRYAGELKAYETELTHFLNPETQLANLLQRLEDRKSMDAFKQERLAAVYEWYGLSLQIHAWQRVHEKQSEELKQLESVDNGDSLSRGRISEVMNRMDLAKENREGLRKKQQLLVEGKQEKLQGNLQQKESSDPQKVQQQKSSEEQEIPQNNNFGQKISEKSSIRDNLSHTIKSEEFLSIDSEDQHMEIMGEQLEEHIRDIDVDDINVFADVLKQSEKEADDRAKWQQKIEAQIRAEVHRELERTRNHVNLSEIREFSLVTYILKADYRMQQLAEQQDASHEGVIELGQLQHASEVYQKTVKEQNHVLQKLEQQQKVLQHHLIFKTVFSDSRDYELAIGTQIDDAVETQIDSSLRKTGHTDGMHPDLKADVKLNALWKPFIEASLFPEREQDEEEIRGRKYHNNSLDLSTTVKKPQQEEGQKETLLGKRKFAEISSNQVQMHESRVSIGAQKEVNYNEKDVDDGPCEGSKEKRKREVSQFRREARVFSLVKRYLKDMESYEIKKEQTGCSDEIDSNEIGLNIELDQFENVLGQWRMNIVREIQNGDPARFGVADWNKSFSPSTVVYSAGSGDRVGGAKRRRSWSHRSLRSHDKGFLDLGEFSKEIQKVGEVAVEKKVSIKDRRDSKISGGGSSSSQFSGGSSEAANHREELEEAEWNSMVVENAGFEKLLRVVNEKLEKWGAQSVVGPSAYERPENP
jgi:hypothetical protein